MEFSDEPDLESVADDLHVRPPAVRRGSRRTEHHRVWIAGGQAGLTVAHAGVRSTVIVSAPHGATAAPSTLRRQFP